MHKQEQYKNIFRFGLSFIIWAIHVVIWAYIWIHEYQDLAFYYLRGNLLVFALYGFISFFFSHVYGGYRIGYFRRNDVSLSNYIAVFFTNTITYLQICLIGRALMPPGPFVWLTIINLITFWAWSVGVFRLYVKIFPPYRMLVVYGGDSLADDPVRKMAGRTEKYLIQEKIGLDAGREEIFRKILEYGSVILCGVPADDRGELLKFCFENDIRTYAMPDIPDILIRSAEDITLFDTPILLNRNNGLTLEQRFVKRAMDIVFAAVMLVLSLPFMLITALCVKLQDGGPAILKQERMTQNGRRFYVYKFRSMIVDAEKATGAKLADKHDIRITPVGSFIRKVRLDELPQLWNIFIGDMSIVGPRPERPELADEHLKTIPEFAYRLKVRAGLTGYAQVVGKYNTSAYDKLKMDLMYISKYSLLLDLKIIFITFKILFKKESTEGMSE